MEGSLVVRVVSDVLDDNSSDPVEVKDSSVIHVVSGVLGAGCSDTDEIVESTMVDDVLVVGSSSLFFIVHFIIPLAYVLNHNWLTMAFSNDFSNDDLSDIGVVKLFFIFFILKKKK